MYGLAITSRTGADPISLAEIKEQVSQDHDLDDDLLTALRDAAIETVEEAQSTILAQATMTLTLSYWPRDGVFVIPRYPVQSITSITYLEEGESTPTTWAASNYRLESDTFPPRVVVKKDIITPTASLESGNPITITFVAGYADGQVPDTPLQSVRFLTAHWYANRESVAVGTIATKIPDTFMSLIMRGRLW